MTGMDEFEHESFQDRQSIRQSIHALIEGFEKGSIMFSSEKESVTLTTAELMRLSIKTRKKQGKSKLSIKLSWNDSTADYSKEKIKAIQISP